MALKMMGKKRGMFQMFDEQGRVVVCTVIEVEPNVVTQVKTKERDGYQAVQLGFEKVATKDPRTVQKRVKKPQLGFFEKIGVEPRKHLSEFRTEEAAEFQVGQEVGVSRFAEIEYVDVTAQSKGKGYQGLMKLRNFRGGPAAHGSGFHRHAGSTGCRTDPGRCFPGSPRPSQMGDKKVTVQNLKIVLVDEEAQLLVVAGQVPGAKNSLVFLTEACKKGQKNKMVAR